MKKWVLFLLIAGFITSNLDSSKVKTENSSQENLTTSHDIKEAQNQEELSSSIVKNDRHFLLMTLDNGEVKKVVLAKISDDSKTLGVATITEREINQALSNKKVNLQTISEDSQLKNKLEANLGVPIDHIVAVEKNGYLSIFSKIFPEGVPLRLSDEMKKDLQVDSNSEMINVNANEFLETIKILKQTKKYDTELNQLIVETISSQLSKPDFAITLFGVLTDVDQHFFTDLTMEQLLTLGIQMMKNPVQEVQKIEVPNKQYEEVMEPIQNEMNHF